MVTWKHLVIALLVVLLGIFGAIYFFQTDSKKIKKQFDSLSTLVSKAQGENPITIATKAKNLGALFAETCEITLPVTGLSETYTPAEVSSYAANTRIAFSQLSLTFYDFKIEFPEQGLARVVLTSTLKGKLMTGDLVDETREVECALKKTDRTWLFSKIEVIEVLKK